jgi:chromosome segregation ATPase
LSSFISDFQRHNVSQDTDDEEVLVEGRGFVTDVEKTTPCLEAMQFQIDDLTFQVIMLEEQNMEIRAERDGLEQEQMEFQEIFASVSAQYAEGSARESKLNSEYDHFKAKFQLLHSVNSERVQLIENELLQFKEQQKRKSSAERDLVQQEQKEIKGTVESLSKQYEESFARESNLNADYDLFKSKLKLLHDLNSESAKLMESEISQLKRDLKEALGREKIFEARCETYTSELVSLRISFMEEWNDMEDSLRSCQRKLDAEVSTTEKLKTEVGSLRHAVDTTQKRKKGLLKGKSLLRNQIEGLSDDKAELECSMMETKGGADHYKTVNRSRAREIDALIHANVRLEKKIKDLDESSVQRHQAVASENAWLGEQLKNYQKRIAELELEYESTKTKLEKSVEQGSTMEAEARQRQSDLENPLTTLQNEMEELRDQAAALNATLSRERDALSEEVEECKNEIQELREERDSYRQRDDELQRNVGSLWGW